MKIREVDFDGVNLLVPDAPWFSWPHPAFDGFPACCGPGPTGHLGEIFVPDKIEGLCISPACWVHDLMFQYGKGRDEFTQANLTFLENMWRINEAHGGDILDKIDRVAEIYIYYSAVDTAAGYFFFCRSKPR